MKNTIKIKSFKIFLGENFSEIPSDEELKQFFEFIQKTFDNRVNIQVGTVYYYDNMQNDDLNNDPQKGIFIEVSLKNNKYWLKDNEKWIKEIEEKKNIDLLSDMNEYKYLICNLGEIMVKITDLINASNIFVTFFDDNDRRNDIFIFCDGQFSLFEIYTMQINIPYSDKYTFDQLSKIIEDVCQDEQNVAEDEKAYDIEKKYLYYNEYTKTYQFFILYVLYNVDNCEKKIVSVFQKWTNELKFKFNCIANNSVLQ